MNYPPLTVIDIRRQTSEADGYTNFPMAIVNNHVIRVAVMVKPFYWHLHPNSDESFLVMEGSLFIDLDGITVELFPGQLFTIPQNTRHRTRPNGGRSVNLTFESQDMETIKLDARE
jgi:mannose-6-phosphate isomerase-like protein (cupin superfamily)